VSDYVKFSLSPGERIFQRGHWPLIYWLGAWAILLLLGIVLVGVVWFVMLAVNMVTTNWAVTSDRIVVKRGLFNLRTRELAVDRIEGVSVSQSLWGRLFNYGVIEVTGTGETALTTPPTGAPVAFRRAIEAARDAARTETGEHGGAK